MTVPVVVFDCMVYLQAAARPEGPAQLAWAKCKRARFSCPLAQPFGPKSKTSSIGPRSVKKFPSLTPEAAAVFLSDIDALATNVTDIPAVVALPRDPKDEPYLNLAAAVGANYLVSWDKDLLDLMSDADFRHASPR